MSKKKLVIVESPGKIKKIGAILGPGYIVKASMGHVMDLPRKGLGIDVKNNFEPTYEIISSKKDVVRDLRAAAKGVDEVFLCPDPDREGNFIAESLRRLLDHKGLTIHRATFNSITKTEILKAINNPGTIDQNLVEAQQARRLLDRLTGFRISPLLWRQAKAKNEKSRSAGRVQSVGLQMIVDRQKEIDEFVSQKYWTIEALVSDGTTEFKMILVQKNKLSIDSKDKADKIVEILNAHDFVVAQIDKSQEQKNASQPFTTSTLQQACSGLFNWTSKQTMAVAQKLYEGGHITYMRTDSVAIADEAIKDIRALIPKVTGNAYLPAKAIVHKTKSQNAQEAHEAIRATDLTNDINQVLTSAGVQGDEKKLLGLIWRRTVASQMVPAVFDKVEVIVNVGKLQMKATGQTLKFDGYLKIWTYTDTKEVTLPVLKVGQKLVKIKIEGIEHETKPPARYNTATLVKELEANGVGRPSTYASIIDTLVDRGYVVMDKKAFEPTEKGKEVSQFLKEYFANIINVGFTSQMEASLDEIAAGNKTRITLLTDFFKELCKTIEAAREKLCMDDVSDIPCPACKKQLYIRLNRKDNKRFLACSNKDCKKTFDMDEKGQPVEREVEALDKKCPKCGGKLLKRAGKFGVFYGCENYKSKGCTVTASEDGTIRTPKKVEKVGRKCKKCKKGDLLVRKNKSTGDVFYGCSRYPDCKYVETAKDSGDSDNADDKTDDTDDTDTEGEE